MADYNKAAVGNYYAELGVASDATTQEIKKAFRKIARECHPDVAGDNPTSAERFKRARQAYEVLSDPVERARYDRRRQPRSNPFDNAWWERRSGPGPDPGFHAAASPGNDLDLEDIFNDFGSFSDFGFGQEGAGPRPPGPGPGRGPVPPHPGRNAPPPGPARSSDAPRPEGAPRRRPGRDITLKVRVPEAIAARGGSVTVTYTRLKRSEDGLRLQSYDELHELRIPPDTSHGSSLRVPRLGDAGEGGPPGDLICDIIVEQAAAGRPGESRGSAPPGRRPSAQDSSAADGSPEAPLPLPISITEALLGGRVEIDTPAGAVRLVIPPCTSSHTVFRLKGQDKSAPDGSPRDLHLAVRIVAPASLDDESRALLLEFARLNPYEPRP